MKRKNQKQNLKLIGAASVLGASAVAVSLFAAYHAATNRLTPVQNNTSSITVSTPHSDVPVNNNIPNVPINQSTKTSKSSSKPAPSTSEPAAEANKPIVVEIGNIMPVEGEISHPFSNNELVKSETLGVWKTHDGCDILCDVGTDVRSMSEGVVKMIDSSSIWGVCVTVEQSNGLEVQYCGLAKDLNVKTGAAVKQGEIIGKTGDTNQAEMLQQPHLHLGVKRGGKWIDPVSVIGD